MMLPRASRGRSKVSSDPPNLCQSSNPHSLGLGDVERAFVHVDYEDDHDINEEHKPLFEKKAKTSKRTLKEILLRTKKETAPETIQGDTVSA